MQIGGTGDLYRARKENIEHILIDCNIHDSLTCTLFSVTIDPVASDWLAPWRPVITLFGKPGSSVNQVLVKQYWSRVWSVTDITVPLVGELDIFEHAVLVEF